MCSQRTLISALISGFIAFTAQSVASADVAIIPNTETSVFGLDSDAPLRDRLVCALPIPQQIRENLAPSTQDNRAYLDSARLGPGWNFPSGELKAPNVLALVQIPLDRTVTHRLTPNLDSPVQNEEAPQVLDLAGDPLHLRLTYPRPNGHC
jgi:hypothetical protein